MFEAAVREGVLRIRRAGTSWLSTGWNGGFSRGPVAYNISVPEGWDHTDVEPYVRDRLGRAGFETHGPTLLTALDLDHARGARHGPVEVYATAGLSNPAALPMDASTETAGRHSDTGPELEGAVDGTDADAGTINLVVGTDRALDEAAMGNLLAVAAEAKAATLLAETGFTGTTTDAVVVACDPAGDPATFTGSATEVGAAARACVRDAVRASLWSRYPDGGHPASVAAAEYGVVTDQRASVFRV